MSKLVVVFGSTGQQGGSVARALIKKGFKVRGVTRNTESEKATKLKELGAEIAKGDLDDVASIDDVVKGVYGVFLVTNYWEYMDKEREITQGKTVADACKRAGVKHLVYSGLELVKDKTGKECPHFDGKGFVEGYLDEIGIPNTSVRYPFYFETFIGQMVIQKQDDNTNQWTVPLKGPADGISVADAGPAVASVFENPKEFIGKKIGLSGDKLTPEEYMAILSKVTGKTYRYQYVPVDVYEKFPFPGAADMASMYNFYERFVLDRDIVLTKRLHPNVKNFETWAKGNKELL
jgi:uncharacterized protein YbjT (DUF2867 family)